MPTVRGTWPGRLVMRSGWGRARARPWNDSFPRASLRLDRGTSSFLRDCAGWLLENAAPDVLSVPLTATQSGPWRSAGFSTYRELAVYERDLSLPIAEPASEVGGLGRGRTPEVVAVDAAAFDSEWRLNRLGLEDALGATPKKTLIGVDVGEALAGYAVVGISASIGYLQRIAVASAHAGSGLGRSILRAAMRWARAGGAHTMLLNTDNAAASSLYRSEGFEQLPEPLVLMGVSLERPA